MEWVPFRPPLSGRGAVATDVQTIGIETTIHRFIDLPNPNQIVFCIECGNELGPTANFCQSCGTQVISKNHINTVTEENIVVNFDEKGSEGLNLISLGASFGFLWMLVTYDWWPEIIRFFLLLGVLYFGKIGFGLGKPQDVIVKNKITSKNNSSSNSTGNEYLSEDE